jgi:hypothetical protein
MPVLARFYGITIRMFFNDHAPPHFHAVYAEHEALVGIQDGSLLRGWLPRRAQRLVEEWPTLHEDDLVERWAQARAGKPMEPIPPLD